ncbi:NEDD4-binding protein 2-like 1 [Anguilla rostrata]|uniref:NEDD4-binding protein 2-like 1 n=1 Tax=Anguilla rostrata TaxID=7938 RepID=UPI0030CC9203
MASRVRRRNRPHLIIMRGLPGSGKTTLSWDIMKEYDYTGEVLSTDDYFIDDYGYYNFDFYSLERAHNWNQERAEEAMQNGVHPIIIDNTNMRRCHMEPYVQMGLEYGYYIKFRTTPDTFRCSVEELHKRANCGITKRVMYRMKKNFEQVETIYDVLNDPG